MANAVNTELWKQYNGKGFAAEYAEYSERANQDVDGNAIVETYATKSEVSEAIADVHAHSNKAILDATTASYTAEEQTKLGGIETGAQMNRIESVKVAGSALSIDSKSVNVPEAGGTAGAWVKGVVSGEDKAKWNSWDSHNYSIPYEKINIAGTDYEIIPLRNRMWTITDLGEVTEHSVLNNSGDPKVRGYQVGYFSEVTNLLPAGWRIANESDWAALRDSGISIRDIKSTTGWNSMNGTNKSGLNFYPFGYYSGGSWVNKGEFSCHASYPGANSCFRVGNYTSNTEEFRFVNYGSDAYLPIRLVKDIT